MIDAGHGGEDSGAIGVHHFKEKSITLKLAKKLAHALNEKGIDALLTRKSDKTLSLDQRTEKAHKNHADLYISLHANASENRLAEGFEIWTAENTHKHFYFLTKRPEIIHGLMLLDAHDQKNRQASFNLAQSIRKRTLQSVSKKYHVKDRQTRPGPKKTHQYLFIPSIIIEAGFITHAKEGRLLQTEEYQNELIKGIAAGIVDYFHTIK
jgi:N-acetylmuramoyl-L-alanine amidase